MKRNRRKQLKVNTTVAQVEALERVARQRNLSKAVLLRDAIAALTGVEAEGYRDRRRFVASAQRRRKGWAAKGRKARS